MLPLSDATGSPRHRFPFVMLGLLALNAVVFAYMLTLGPRVEEFVRAWGTIPQQLATGQDLDPQIPVPIWLTPVTSMFLHGSLLHLAVNMIFLWVFGDNVEDRFGHGTFAAFYLLAGLAAAGAHVALEPMSTVPAIGASGAVAGVLAAYYLLFPTAEVRVLLIFGPIITIGRVAALILIGFWFVIQLVEAAFGETEGIAFFAHIGGFLFGLLATASLQRVRGRPLGQPGPVEASSTFRNWLVLIVAGSLVLGLASLLNIGLLAMVTLAAVALLALVDGLRRVAGRPSLLGPGRGPGRALAGVQLLLSVVLLANLAAGTIAF